MRYTITVDIPDELVEVLRAAGYLVTPAIAGMIRPARQAGEDPIEPEHRPSSNGHAHNDGRQAATATAPTVTAQDLWDHVKGNDDLKRKAQGLGKRAGHGWKITTWPDPFAAEVYRQLVGPSR